MKIGILSAGRMGQALAELLRNAGHDVALGARATGLAAFPTIALNEAIAGAEVVMIALPHDAIESNLELLASITDSTIVIDVASAVNVESGRIRTTLGRPHGRWLADVLPHVKVARAFTHVHELLASRAVRQPGAWAIGVAADDSEALAISEELVRGTGYVSVPVGDLDRSAVLDPGGPLFPNMYLPGDMRDLLDLHSA